MRETESSLNSTSRFVSSMHKIILIGIAGLTGTLLRYWLSGLVARQYGETFPWGTMVVNIVGCLVTGAVFNLTEERFLVNPDVTHHNSNRIIGWLHHVLLVRPADVYVNAIW
jgi:hypothetical protein